MEERLTQGPLLVEYLGTGARRFVRATLNAEASLNSLTMEMIDLLTPRLAAWAKDASIAGVLLDGAGDKAFCAGGDIRRLHDGIKGGQLAGVDSFFEKEYALDLAIHRFPKPFVVWGNGIVMGGGLGLMAGASHRIATESTKMAMPEITIGLYPDVGASWFLNRLPPGLGLFLGMTGARLNAADALFTSLANAFVSKARRAEVIAAIANAAWSADAVENVAQLNKLLAPLEAASMGDRPASEIARRIETITAIGLSPDVATFKDRLNQVDAGDAWLQGARKTFEAGSPSSARLIVEQLRRLRGLSLEACFAVEVTLSKQCARHPDLVEGIRALLIEKDNQPKWSPAAYADVNVDAYFRKPGA